jgi:DNA-binding response OmpR family regulator
MEKHILLVEDEEGLRMALGHRLRHEGYAVDCVSDGETGFQKATSLLFDLMILDVMLPGRTGVDLCRDIRRAGLTTPVLMLSARRQRADIMAGFRAGADEYVTKPFSTLELMARIETLLRRAPTSEPQNDSEVPGSGTAAGPGFRRDPIMVQQDELLDEFCRRLATDKDPLLMAKVASRLRMLLEEEQKSPDTHLSSSVLSIVEGITDFLEEMLARIRRSAF